MKSSVHFLLVVVLSASAASVSAQKPKPAGQQTQKFKPPKLTCMLGNHADSATVVLEEALQLVTLPLRITDDKKNPYTVSSYQLFYKRKALTEDEETGKTSPTTSSVAQLFRETPISGIWKKNLLEQIRPGDELHFFDVIVKDAQGRLMFAPELKIRVK